MFDPIQSVSKNGAIFTYPHAPRFWTYQQEFTSQQAATVIKAQDQGTGYVITNIYVQVAGAVTITINAPSGLLWSFYGQAAGDGAAVQIPILVQDQEINITSSTGATFFVALAGYSYPIAY